MKRFGSIAAVLLVFILSALALIIVYDKGKDQKPLRYADIPPETIDWINSLGEGINDIFSVFNPTPRPTPWDNGTDIGKDPETGLSMLEDEYFIIYYPESLEKKAKLTLQYAHEAIPRMEDIIGKYYYPSDMNGRKVSIYIAKAQEEFDSLMIKFGFHGDYGNVDGVTISEISPSGYYLTGIVIKGQTVFRTNEYHREVLWHEMTHYCFGASIDYNQKVKLPMWCTEGIAEYTGIVDRRPSFSEEQISLMRKECDLSEQKFQYVFEVYWGGHSIFCHMEDRYQKSGVRAFLKTLYKKGIPASLKENFSTTLPEFEADWKANLDKFKK